MELTHVFTYSLPLLFVVAFLVMTINEERAARRDESSKEPIVRLKRPTVRRRPLSRSRRREESGNVTNLFAGPQN